MVLSGSSFAWPADSTSFNSHYILYTQDDSVQEQVQVGHIREKPLQENLVRAHMTTTEIDNTKTLKLILHVQMHADVTVT